MFSSPLDRKSEHVAWGGMSIGSISAPSTAKSTEDVVAVLSSLQGLGGGGTFLCSIHFQILAPIIARAFMLNSCPRSSLHTREAATPVNG